MNKEELLEGNYAYLIIKNDAITRNIDQEILKYLKNRIIIKEPIRMKLTEEQVKIIKKEEWENKWTEPPTGYILDLVLKYEAQEVLVVPCEYMGKETFKILHKLKGNHHIPFMCNHDSVRWIFRDKNQIERLFEYSDDILLEKDKEGNISFPECIMHTPDSKYENDKLKECLFN